MGHKSSIEEATTSNHAVHVDDSVVPKAHHLAEATAGARSATEQEHNMTFMQAIKLYPKAMAWSILLSTAIVMEGYDVVLIGSFYALPQFNEKYGVQLADGTYTIPAPWKSGLSNGALCGSIMGLFINGIVSEKYGYKKTMIGALMLMTAVIFVPFFAPNLPTLLVGEILCGIPWGIFQVCPILAFNLGVG